MMRDLRNTKEGGQYTKAAKKFCQRECGFLGRPSGRCRTCSYTSDNEPRGEIQSMLRAEMLKAMDNRMRDQADKAAKEQEKIDADKGQG